MRRLWSLIFTLPLALALLMLHLPDAAARTSVTMSGSRFSPRQVTVSAGETVTWTNNDSVGHSVAADDGSFDSHPTCGTLTGTCMERGESFSVTFSKAGTVRYYCRSHGGPGGQGMSGTVTVTR